MKKTLLFLALTMIGTTSLSAQSLQTAGLNSILEKSAGKLVYKVKKDTTIEKIGVYYFRNADRSISPLGIYLAEEYSTQLAMHPDAPQLVARTSIEAVIDEKSTKLTANDEYSATIKLGKLNVADAVVSGTITKVGNEYNIDIKLYNSANGNIIAADKFTINGKEYDDMYDGGVVHQGSQPKECQTNKTCTVCFTNNFKTKDGYINVRVGENINSWASPNMNVENNITVKDGKTACIYDVNANSTKEWSAEFYLSVYDWQQRTGVFKGNLCEKVSIIVE